MVDSGEMVLAPVRPIGHRSCRYVFANGLCLESFAGEALLLVTARDRLLTVNTAAADLFAAALQALGGGPFTIDEGSAWLAGHYEMDPREGRIRTRGLLAFALKHGLALRAGRGA